MEFCEQCQNKIIIDEDNIHYCITCNYEQKKNNSEIYIKSYIENSDEIKLNKYMIYDKTLPTQKIKCPKCKCINHNIYTMNIYLKIIYRCINPVCFYEWKWIDSF